MPGQVWFDTHIHVSVVGPDGVDRPGMVEDLLEGAGVADGGSGRSRGAPR